MPELPEVETLVRNLRAELVGEVIRGVEIRWPRTVAAPEPEVFSSLVVRHCIAGVARRAKFLMFTLWPADGAAGDGHASGPAVATPLYLVAHLRMTGQFLLAKDVRAPILSDPHVHMVLYLGSGRAVCFHDARKFGRVWALRDVGPVLGDLGVEPLSSDFTPELLAELLAERRRQIKPLLLDQRTVAGLGNIYVDESLWQARIHPLRRADTLNPEEVARLYAAIRQILSRAVENKGTTLRDFRDANNEPGENQLWLAVYGRADEPCPRCGRPIVRTVVGSRGTHLCPHCQIVPPIPEEGS